MLKKQTEKYHLQWYHSEHLLRHHGMQKNVKFQVNDKIINLEISHKGTFLLQTLLREDCETRRDPFYLFLLSYIHYFSPHLLCARHWAIN